MKIAVPSLPSVLQEHLEGSDQDHLLRTMGYRGNLDKPRVRLAKVIADPELGLGQHSYFDMTCDAREFVTRLSEALGLDSHFVRHQICTIQRLHDRKRSAFRRYIAVHTGFKRASQTVISLAAMQHHLFIPLSMPDRLCSADQCLKRVSVRIRDHYHTSDGCLPLWGKITGYALQIAPNQKVLFDCQGRIIEETTGSAVTHSASVSIKGKDLTPLIR